MQSLPTSSSLAPVAFPLAGHFGTEAQTNPLAAYNIIRRNGAVVPFEPNKIAVAIMKASLAVHGTQGAASASVRENVDALTQQVMRALMRSRPGGGTFHIEDVQDQVELGLMRAGNHEVARAYVLYRERRAQERAKQQAQVAPAALVGVPVGGLRAENLAVVRAATSRAVRARSAKGPCGSSGERCAGAT